MHPPSSEPSTPGLHPLGAIAPLQGGPRSLPRDLGSTLLVNAVVGLLLIATEQLFFRHPHPLPLILAWIWLAGNVVGFMIHGALYCLQRMAPALATGRHARLARMAVTIISVLCGIALARALLYWTGPLDVPGPGMLTTILVYAVVTALAMRGVLLLAERHVSRETAAARQQEQIATASRLLAEARLRALQAQIEPHFLYNTLANVLSLIDTRPDQARHMLERFIDYLRASLAASRAESATLGVELDQAAAYLDVLSVRMGERLRYRIESDPACRQLPIAPMLLQPLVENAVMHGIEPTLEGGEIVVRTRIEDGVLCIEVSDNGLGLGVGQGLTSPRPGGGVGLHNLRERLRQLHGPHARLQLFDNQPCGVSARLLLPLTVPSSTIHAP